MSNTSFVSKFQKYFNTLTKVVEGSADLEMVNPKLYKKLRKFYESNGVQFYDDPSDDYELLIDCLSEDLERSGVLA